MMPLLDVQELSVSFRTRSSAWRKSEVIPAVVDVNFQLDKGEVLGIVGESGSGKSTTARALLRLQKAQSGKVLLDGEDVLQLSDREFRERRRRMQMVFQDPYSSLDPSMVISESIAEPLRLHTPLRGGELLARVTELLDMVGLGSHHLNRYPHEFSGGQRQRIAIARAIAVNPDIVICDEAVSALDLSTQNQIINLLEDLAEETGVSYLFISHDLAVVHHIASRVLVMNKGVVVEQGVTDDVFSRPQHPYTEMLLASIPSPRPREVLVGG